MTLPQKRKRTWIKLNIRCPEDLSEPIADFLISTLNRGVMVEDEPETISHPYQMTQIHAYITQQEINQGLLKEIKSYLKSLSELESGYPEIQLTTQAVLEEDWAEQWKSYFKPVKIGKKFVIKPSWEEYIPNLDEIVIEIDPGQAFGTGSHPTTCLMLEALEQTMEDMKYKDLPKGIEVLDVGTGTGILGIAAVKLGAASVLGIDIDPVAVETARKNVYANHAHKQMVVSSTPLWQVEGGYHLVLANLDKNTLELLAKDLVEKLASEGFLIISGILQGQEEGLIDLFKNLGLDVKIQKSQKDNNGDEWLCIIFETGCHA